MTRRRSQAQQPVGTRRAAREFAFRVLFEANRGDLELMSVFRRNEAAMLGGDDTFAPLSPEALGFAEALVGGLERHQDELDTTLRRTIRGWSFEQMAQTDLNVLRLATYELLYTDEPHPPVIESAVRIARKFGGEDSGRFVNGVLGGLSRSLPAREATTTNPQAANPEADLPEKGLPHE